jgi:phosphatidylethanolamine/phosphatidyl-N-methylethanolamine N-methyltransferase
MTELDFANIDLAESVVELGTGTGAITRYLAPRLKNPSKYLGIEMDENMVEYMKRQYPELRFESGKADTLGQWRDALSVDAVVSSLPWTVFSDEVQEKTIDAIDTVLKPGGCFVTYLLASTIWSPSARSLITRLNAHFETVERSRIQWKNIPPAYVFRAIKSSTAR